RPIRCDVDDAEVDTLDAWRARPDEGGDRRSDRLPASDRRERDVVVNGIVGEKCRQFAGADIVGPRRAEPAHDLDRALHLAPPAVDLVGTLPLNRRGRARGCRDLAHPRKSTLTVLLV